MWEESGSFRYDDGWRSNLLDLFQSVVSGTPDEESTAVNDEKVGI